MPTTWPKCTAGDLAKLLGVSAASVSQWVDAGMPCARGRTKGHAITIEPERALPWVLARREPKGSQRARLAKEQADKVALDNAAKRGELVKLSLVADVMLAQAADISGRLDGLAGRVASEFAGISDPAEIRARLLDECRTIRAGHAEYIDRLAASAGPPSAAGDDLPPAAQADGQRVGRRKPRAAGRKRRARAVAKR